VLSSLIKPYFWDVDPDTVDCSVHVVFVIERILESGDEDAIRWLFATYSRTQVVEVLQSTRRISRRSARFWANVLGVPTQDVSCLSKSFQRTYRAIWTR
jgi:hypothetical protein